MAPWSRVRQHIEQELARELEQLNVARALSEDATRDTVLWLQTDPSAVEREHVLAIQAGLADLNRIVERRIERRRLLKDGWEWAEAVADVLSHLEKAKQARGNIVGKGLARLADYLPKELPGKKPRPKLPEPVKPLSTALISENGDDTREVVMERPSQRFDRQLFTLKLSELSREMQTKSGLSDRMASAKSRK